MNSNHRDLIKRAAQMAGGDAALAERLGISPGRMRAYLDGQLAPDDIMLRVVDFLQGLQQRSAQTTQEEVGSSSAHH